MSQQVPRMAPPQPPPRGRGALVHAPLLKTIDRGVDRVVVKRNAFLLVAELGGRKYVGGGPKSN